MSESNPGEAIQARREAVAATERPERLSTLDIRGAVADVRETADLYKVYVPEWLTVFTSLASGPEGLKECEAHFAEKYAGRVIAADVRYEPISQVLPDDFGYRLVLRLPNTKGEFKYRELAEQYVTDNRLYEAVIVARNSRDEYKLKDYGVKRLPVAS